jgi:putative FmdB family regulatory protein
LICGAGCGSLGIMPLYEYVCRRCGRGFEELVRADTVVACPGCAATDVTRVMSVVTIGHASDGAARAPGACGTCGDPRGPGACAMD